MIVQCCVCKKVRTGSTWARGFSPGSPKEVSHGYCPQCYQQALDDIARFKTEQWAKPWVAASNM